MKTSLLGQMRVLDHGHLLAEAVTADDLGVINAARVSFAQHDHELTPRGEGLIRFLMENRHGTPFEHNYFRFRVKAPIFVFREWHRHRIGHSYNEMSARYTELPEEFYVPSLVLRQIGKPGAYTYEPMDAETTEAFREDLRIASKTAFVTYKAAIEAGVSKQQARLFLPVNTYSEMIWTCNARSLMAFLSLRNHPAAQYEIQQYAKAAEEVFVRHMPVTAAAFIKNGRVGP